VPFADIVRERPLPEPEAMPNEEALAVLPDNYVGEPATV
jgi:hypothetical protein